MPRSVFLGLLVIVLASEIPAQTTEIDSLFTELARHRSRGEQTEECIALRQLSGLIYATGDYALAMQYADSALAVLPPGRPDLENHLNFIQYSIAAQQWAAYPEEHVKLLDTAYNYLVTLEDSELEIPFLNYYGFQLSSYGYQARAFPLLKRIDTLAQGYPGKFAEARLASYDRQLDLYKNEGNYAEATRAFRKFRDLWGDRPANSNTISLWNNYAAVLWATGDKEQYRRAMRRGLNEALAINDSTSTVATLTSMAANFLQAGELDSVPIVLERARVFLNPEENPGGRIAIQRNYATYYNGRGMFERALSELEPLAEMCQPLSAPPDCRYVYYEIARNLDTLKRYDEIPPVLAASLEQARRQGDTRLASISHWFLARIERARGRPEIAIDHFMEHAALQDVIYDEDLQQAIANERTLQEVEEERSARDRAELATALARSRSRSFQLLALALGGLLLVGGLLLWLLSRARTKLRANNERLAELNATKDKFFGLIAHDLRGPIVALQGVDEQVNFHLSRNRPEKIKTVAANISTTANGLEHLLNQLLQWALLQTGMIPYAPEEVSVAQVFQDNLTLYREMANTKGISLTVSASEDLTVFSDPRAVATIVRNLLNNALKFTPPEGNVNLSAAVHHDKILIEVTDTGTGMADGQLDQLFLRPQRSRQGTAGETGAGLGLQLVRELTELNRGRIEVQSSLGTGTAFQVWLPAHS
ncbi:HAMP domain-containing sensor histidine kinase [Lewinella sp. W8]|uniref:tetratricopeptide repeat-containing sensor histidine kinase n=1 Tax=Lewinella sp. W8 TaxID=2528208 RepID=UPI0010678B44|nr:HAMP domain-containing sensor histidine kinase [Lewinella sp. W8]MTB50821.1 hypothetical protein [Lewinella sp. W8]